MPPKLWSVRVTAFGGFLRSKRTISFGFCTNDDVVDRGDAERQRGARARRRRPPRCPPDRGEVRSRLRHLVLVRLRDEAGRARREVDHRQRRELVVHACDAASRPRRARRAGSRPATTDTLTTWWPMGSDCSRHMRDRPPGTVSMTTRCEASSTSATPLVSPYDAALAADGFVPVRGSPAACAQRATHAARPHDARSRHGVWRCSSARPHDDSGVQLEARDRDCAERRRRRPEVLPPRGRRR